MAQPGNRTTKPCICWRAQVAAAMGRTTTEQKNDQTEPRRQAQKLSTPNYLPRRTTDAGQRHIRTARR